MNYLRTYLEIDTQAICHNIDTVKATLPENVGVLAVIKADAYGHGAVTVGKALEERGTACFFGVATLEEGIELRQAGLKKPILMLGYTSPSQMETAVSYDLIPAIFRLDTAKALSEAATQLNKTAKCHIALDTGMGRIGFPVNEENADLIAGISELPGIEIDGIFSHFATADETDKTFSRLQMKRFDTMMSMLSERGVKIPHPHLCNSAGVSEFADHRFSMVRSGIVTYGLYPSDEVDRSKLSLQPAMSWRTRISHIKTVQAGDTVSYGRLWKAEKPTVVATLPVGYADGYPRSLSNRGFVLIRGKKASILGRVCMDQMMVDITDIPEADLEDTVTLVGKDGDAEISMEEIGKLSGRFHYEFPCMISKRVPRIQGHYAL